MSDAKAFIEAARQMFPEMKLYGREFKPWSRQKAFVNDEAGFRAALGSRGVGKTMMIAWDAVQKALDASSGTEIVIASPSLRQSKKVMGYVKEFLSDYKLDPKKQTEVGLPGKVKIIAVPNRPDTIRGFHGPVYIDEADLFQNRSEILPAVLFMAGNGYPVTVSGTPYGRGGILYQVFNEWADKRVKWSTHKLHYSECPFMDMDTLDAIRAMVDEVTWRQEMEMEFIDDNLAWLPYDLLLSCAEDYEWTPSAEQGYPHMYRQYAPGQWQNVIRGTDFATETQTAIIDAVIEPDGTIRVIGDTTFYQAPYEEQLEWIELHSDNVVRHAYDATGVGTRLSEEIQARTRNIWNIPVTFTNKEKAAMMGALRVAFEQGRIRIPLEDRALLTELNSIRREQTGTTTKFEGSGRHGGKKHHADRAWALALIVAKASDISPSRRRTSTSSVFSQAIRRPAGTGKW